MHARPKLQDRTPKNRRWIAGVFFAALLLGTAAAETAFSAGEEVQIFPHLPYAETHVSPDRESRQSLDLYVPVNTLGPPPLVVFIHGGFWMLSDEKYGIGKSLANVLVKRGVAVALVRYRLAPQERHPAQAQDVAQALSYLIRRALQYGYDREKIFLVGHSAGAHLAALVALDPVYLAEYEIAPRQLAGVVAISGLYDLTSARDRVESHRAAIAQAFGDRPEIRLQASPVRHTRAVAPGFLILTAANDFYGFHVDAKRFADALEGAGHQRVEQYILPDRDHFSIMDLNRDNPARALLLNFFGVETLTPHLTQWTSLKKKWRNPAISTEPFWEDTTLVRSYPVDARFVHRLSAIYGPMKFELLEWPLEKYHAMDLFAYLDSLSSEKVGRGNFLVLTNIRNEKQVWRREELEPYHPVLVIGVDDERNLFRMTMFYRMLREYSWKPGAPPPVMARPVGGFIHFLNDPPVSLQPKVWHSSLGPDSFRLADRDPLRPLRNVPRPVFEVLTYRNGCISCHSFRGIGSRSHHNLAATGEPHGGFALPLEKYPRGVWREFIFNQKEVARKMGATPNMVAKNARQLFYDLIVAAADGDEPSGKGGEGRLNSAASGEENSP